MQNIKAFINKALSFLKIKKVKQVLNNFKPKKIKDKKKLWRAVLIYSAYAVLGLILVTAGLFAYFSIDLPTPEKVASAKPADSTKLYDRTGTILLYETGEEKRTVVNSDQISQYLKDATVSTEDANFYKHHGIDFKEIAVAVFDRLIGKTNVTRGASTITQQYVKNSLLSDDRSLSRKIKEAILAIELESMYSKDQILTMYLNEIPYGNAAAGAEAASQMYFGKSAKDLTLAEAATLAAIPQAPTYYSPYGTHTSDLIDRRNYVLDRMVINNKITKAQAEDAKKQDTTTLGLDLKPRKDSILAPHFAMYVLEQIVNQYGEAMVQKQGLKIITTLDYSKQKIAEDAVTTGVPKVTKYGANNAALVSVDPKTGEVLAMVGSKDYFDQSIDGQVNVTDSLRQPGSSFKPFTYATAFKRADFSPSRMLYDFTTDFGGGYIPHNYTGKNYGPVPVRIALDNSLNIPAIKTMSLVGISNVIQTAHDMGVTSLNDTGSYGLSLALGVGEIKPIEMANGFAAFADNGVHHDIKSVLKITDSQNKTLYEYKPDQDKGTKALEPEVAYEINNILSDNNARALVFGTRTSLYFPDRTVAAKTGTTDDFKDAWTVGYTPSLATAVWVGNTNDKAMTSGADGSVVAAPIFHTYMANALAGTPNQDFDRPSTIQTLTVEKYSNKLPNQYSTDKVTDIFAPWQVPKDTDDVHKIVTVCKGTNQIAPDGTPANLVEQKVFVNLHSERPDNPNWENPVRAWAAANGMVSDAPTATCDPNTLSPKINIDSPADGATLSGQTTISATPSGPNPIQKVEFFVDDVSIGSVTASPYSETYDFNSLADGPHKITAVATDSNGVTATQNINITSSNNSAPAISNVSVSFNAANTTISWATDESTSSNFAYYPDGNSAKRQTLTDQSTLAHSLTISNLIAGQKYDYTISATNSKSITATSNGTFTVPLNSENTGQDITKNPTQ